MANFLADYYYKRITPFVAGDSFAALNPTTQIRSLKDGWAGGNGYIGGQVPGIVTVDSLPASRELECRVRESRKLIATTWSSPIDGTYLFDNLNPNVEYDIIARDHDRVYRDVIAPAVYPVSYKFELVGPYPNQFTSIPTPIEVKIIGGTPPYNIVSSSGIPAANIENNKVTIEFEPGVLPPEIYPYSFTVGDSDSSTISYSGNFEYKLGYISGIVDKQAEYGKITRNTVTSGSPVPSNSFFASFYLPVPVVGKRYISGTVEILNPSETLSSGGIGFIDASNLVVLPQSAWIGNTLGSIGVYSNTLQMGVYKDGTASAYLSAPPETRFELAIDSSTRRVWVRRHGGVWIGGGDPAANTLPTTTLQGSSDIYAAVFCRYVWGVTATLHDSPSIISGDAPAGFTKGLY